MKIGIITLLDEKNYGNRWQNYAMNELLQSMGIKTENIYFWRRNAQRNCFREKIKRIMPIRLAYLLHIMSAYQIKDCAMLNRVLKFTRFTKQYMGKHLVLGNTYEELCDKFDSSSYDYFAAGSDQVWNPYYVGDPIYFLRFADKRKRLSFMASFGSDEIPEKQIKKYKMWLEEMSYISVREPSGATIIKNITGKHADIFYDPTLILEREKWVSLSHAPQGIPLPSNYAVSFMFDCESEKLKEICSEQGMDLLILNDKNNRKLYSLDPAEMLYVLNHSNMVFTDSFHIMALSIRLNKQFYAFKRKGFEYMFSRLESTLERLSITQCIYLNDAGFTMCPIKEKEYKEINRRLEQERIRFMETVCTIIK